MKSQIESLTVFMPFYNEEEMAESSVKQAIEHLDSIYLDYKLLMIDDGSKDNTRSILSEISCKSDSTELLSHERNQGYGKALSTGFEAAESELIFYTDGDGQFDLSELQKFLEEMGDADILTGYRKHRKDGIDRKITSKTFNILCRVLLPVEERDVDCAFKLVRKEVIENIDITTERTVDAELLAKARSEGYTIKEMPVTHKERRRGNSEAEGLIGVRMPLVAKTIKELIEIRRSI